MFIATYDANGYRDGSVNSALVVNTVIRAARPLGFDVFAFVPGILEPEVFRIAHHVSEDEARAVSDVA